jgi:ATP-dependent Clp protease protease subunit
MTRRQPDGCTTQIDPYDRLFEDRVIFIGSPISDSISNDVIAQMLALEAEDASRDVTIYVNSPGGLASAMASIVDTMEYIKPSVQTICVGQAVNASAIILAAGEHGKRFILPNADVVLHQPAMGSDRGKATEIAVLAGELDRVRDWMEGTLSRFTGQSVKTIHKDIEYNKVFTAKQALDYGLVDGIIDRR